MDRARQERKQVFLASVISCASKPIFVIPAASTINETRCLWGGMGYRVAHCRRRRRTRGRKNELEGSANVFHDGNQWMTRVDYLTTIIHQMPCRHVTVCSNTGPSNTTHMMIYLVPLAHKQAALRPNTPSYAQH